jgi:hypothetical protein
MVYHEQTQGEENVGPLSRGSLIVEFSVVFPPFLTPEHLSALATALSPDEIAALQQVIEHMGASGNSSSNSSSSNSSSSSSSSGSSNSSSDQYATAVAIDDSELDHCSMCASASDSGSTTDSSSTSGSSSSDSGVKQHNQRHFCLLDELAFTWPPRQPPRQHAAM